MRSASGPIDRPRTGHVVANSSPLIALAAVGKLALLSQLYERVLIPEAVYREVVVHGQDLPGSREVPRSSWITTTPIQDHLAVHLLAERLGAGESEAIVLAQESDADLLLIDEEIGRRTARRIGLDVVGTLGVLLLAKQAGLVPAVEPLLHQLSEAGFRMSERVQLRVLAKAGESPE